MSDDQLSEIFKRDLPQQTGGQWADDARHRATRRRATIGGVAVVAALAVVAPFALRVFTQDADTAVPAPIGVEPFSDPTQGPGGEPTTAATERDAACAGANDDAVDELPTTARRLWLCDEPGETGSARTGPQDPLVQGVDEALAAFHALEKSPADIACTGEYTLTYVVVAEGADGTLTPVRGELHGCRTIGNRLGGDGYLENLRSLWQAQRADGVGEAPGSASGALCSAPASIFGATIDDVTQAAMCAPDTEPGTEGHELAPELLERVRADFAANAVDGTLAEWDPTARLILASDWGEELTLSRHASGTYHTDNKIWRPKGELAEALDALVSGLETDPIHAAETPNCDEGRAAATATGATIEGDIASAGICVENREGEPRYLAPTGWLVEPDAVGRVVEMINDAPALAVRCEDTSRADVFVEFRDEMSSVVAAARISSCGPTTGAEAKDLPDFVERYSELMRESYGLDGVGVRYGARELCPQLNALVEFDPSRGEPAQVVACVGAESLLPVDLDADVVQQVGDEFVMETSGFDETDVEPAEEGGTLIWVNKWGEPMTMVRTADGGFVWNTSDVVHRWKPTGELKERLDAIFGL